MAPIIGYNINLGIFSPLNFHWSYGTEKKKNYHTHAKKVSVLPILWEFNLFSYTLYSIHSQGELSNFTPVLWFLKSIVQIFKFFIGQDIYIPGLHGLFYDLLIIAKSTGHFIKLEDLLDLQFISFEQY